MRILGFNFQKGKIRAVFLDGNEEKQSFLDRRSWIIDPELKLSDLMDRYLLNFRGLFDEYKPDAVACRLVYESESIDSATSQVMPVAILGLACHEKSLPLRHYTPQALRASSAFGLAKGQKPLENVDEIFGSHPPYWDDVHKTALLVAWRALLEINK